MRVNLLGPDLLTVGGHVTKAGGPGQRALLIRLALAEGHLVTADRLVEDLWGDEATDTILSTLQGYISRLRTTLGDASRLRRSGPGYVLDVDVDEVDARRFEALVGEGRRLLADDPGTAADVLATALALWRGPALPEVASYAWGATAAAHLDAQRLLATELRFDALLACGRHEAAVADIGQAVDAHPLHERFVAQLMVALYRCGRQAKALREYESARRRLADELGLDPSPDLARHETAILNHEPWLAAPSLDSTTPLRTVADPAPSVPPPAPAPAPVDTGRPDGPLPTSRGPLPPVLLVNADRPFVGRDAQLAVLHDAWRSVGVGSRRLVLLEGEAGIGKTRLAARFAADVHDAGSAVLFGRATNDSVLPYEPFVEVMRGILRRLPPPIRERFIAERPAVRSLVPLLGDLAPADGAAGTPDAGTPDDTDPAVDRYLLFETVAEMASTMSAKWPLLFVVDDLHWVDALTVRLLAHLLGHERPIRLMILATMRTVPRVANPALDALLGELAGEDVLVRIPLGGLDEREVAELLESSGVPAAEAASVVQATRGNAFFVTEIAEHAGEHTLPATVRDALAVRLGRLSDPATRLVRTAAVAGPVAPTEVLQAASGLDDAGFLDAVDELLAGGFLVEEAAADTADDGGVGAFADLADVADRGTPSLAFRHGLVQQAVEDGLVLVRRRAIHARLAATYAHRAGAALRHAHHAIEAGDLVGVDERVTAAVAAGREALALFAPEDAIGWAQLALGHGDRAAPTHRCAALLLLSDAHRALGDRATARAVAGDAAEVARELADPTWLAAAAEAVALARAGVGFDFGVDDDGLDALLREALDRLPAADVQHRSRLLAAGMSNAAASGDLYALRGLSQTALELAERHGQQALVATAHLAARMSVWRVDMLEQRLRSDLAAYEAAEASGRMHLQLNALLYLVSDLAEAGRAEESAAWFERLRELAGRVRQPVYDAFVDFFDARTALLAGRYEDATKLADRGLDVGRTSHGVNAEQAWAGVMFARAWDEGWLASIGDVIERSAQAAPRFPIWRIAHAASALAGGDAAEPAEVLGELVTGTGLDLVKDSLWFSSVALLTEMARSLDDAERAAVLARELAPFTGRLTISGLGRVSLGPVDRFLGIATLTAGDVERADELLAAAVDQARRIGAEPHVARALWDRAQALERRGGRGDATSAEELRAEAATIAERVGLVLGPLGAAR